MDDDVDIYGDLPSFNVNECAKCKERAEEFAVKYAKLEEEISLWKGKCENLEQERKTILTNSSSLMKTARAEVNRKDRTIIELRRELEDVKFRRGVWSKSKTNHHNRQQYNRQYHAPKEHTLQRETTRYEKELSIEGVKTELRIDQSAAWTQCDEDEEDPEQKWNPECKNFTVYGERLRKKLLQEQDAERIQKEEARTSESKSFTQEQETTIIPKEEKDEISESESSALLQEQETAKIQQEEAETSQFKSSATLRTQETERIQKEEHKTMEFKSSALLQEQEMASVRQEAKTSQSKGSAPLREQEMERNQKKKISTSESRNFALLQQQEKDGDLNLDKMKEKKRSKAESKSIPSDGTQLAKVEEERDHATGSSVQQKYQTDEHYGESNEEGELSDSSELQSENENHDCESDVRIDGRYETSPHHRPEMRHREDSNKRNLNVEHDLRYNILNKSRNRSRNSRGFGFSDQSSRRHGKSKPTHQNHDLRSRSSHQSRSKTLDCKYQKINNTHRKEKHRDHKEKYEKCRDDRLTRDKFHSEDNHDLRDKCERKYDDRFVSRNDRDINYDSDHKRPRKSRSPGGHSRSKSNSSRSSQNDRRRNERSKSRGRFTIHDGIVLEKDRTDEKRKSRDRKIVSKEHADGGSQSVQSAKESSNRNFVNNIKTTNDSRIMNHEESRDKSKRTNSHHNEKRPIDLPKLHQRQETDNGKESKAERNEKKEESRNREILNRGNDFSEKVESFPESSRKILEGNVNTNSKELRPVNSDEPPEKTSDNAKAQNVRSKKIPAPTDTQDKFILMLENDSEVALSPIIRREIESIGSRSFREEKIENIEKFIQDYQYDASHSSLLGIDTRPEQEGENNLGNSTSSIVDTLSMDVDEAPKELEPKITKISESSVNASPKKSKENPVDKNLETHVVSGNLTTVPKVDSCSVEKPTDALPEKKSKEVIDRKYDKVIVNEKNKCLSVDKTAETGAVQKEKTDTIGKLEITCEGKKDEIFSDKLEGSEIDKKQAENRSIDKTTKSENNSHRVGRDGKSGGAETYRDEKTSKKVHKNLEKIDADKQSKINELFDSETGSKESRKKLDDFNLERKLKSSNLPEKTHDTPVNGDQVFLDRKLNVSPEEIRDNGGVEKKLDGVPKNAESAETGIDKNSGKTEVKKSDETIEKISPSLPPSSRLVSLPPLAPSPPPEEKEPEITIVPEKRSTAEEKEPPTEKVISKQVKNRPRIPCLPIVSLYSRKRRGIVLTDSTSSHTIVSSLRSTKTLDAAKENEVSGKETSKIVSKSDSISIKIVELPVSNEIQSKNSTGRSAIPETGDKTAPTKLVEAQNIPKLKKDDKIVTVAESSSLDRDEPEMKFSPNLETSNEDEISKKVSPVGSSAKEKIIVVEKANDLEDKAERQAQPKIDPTKNSQPKNSHEIQTNGTSFKHSERTKRSVLKSIASTTTSTESGSSNRKRPLSKEKENQSKPAKQIKVMVIKRRRPVQLEDSSTVTTLVPSEHEESSKDNKVLQYLEKNAISARKRRAVES
ncbi:myb-like protein X [Venturia canescens]|uniref:myb-like protein X n=1 Tax=Venturia canescens TaxID=32260 RepID=UPI001C9C001B|nr:myb-like protein X [Venturia canescens]